jgi:hypothetical protein
MTSGVDVAFAVLGNNAAVSEITSRIGVANSNHRDGLPYQHNLASSRQAVDSLDSSFWSNSIYNSW